MDVPRLEVLAGRLDADQQAFVNLKVSANPLMGSAEHTIRHDPVSLRHNVERRYFHVRECSQDVLKYVSNHIPVDWNTMVDDMVSEKFALSGESFLLYSPEHLPNGNFILLFERFHFSFKLKIVRYKVPFFQEGLHKVQFVPSVKAVIKTIPMRKFQRVWQAAPECL
jgi:hypothetical protein